MSQLDHIPPIPKVPVNRTYADPFRGLTDRFGVNTPETDPFRGRLSSTGRSETPIDEKQEAYHPFAISVEVTGRGVGGDWTSALVKVLSGTYKTAGGTAYEANGVSFPSEAFSGTETREVNGGFRGYVYLYVPLEADSSGVPIVNSAAKVVAIDGGEIRLRSTPAVEWPNAVRVVGGVAAAVRLGTWSINRVNISAGAPTYELRVNPQNVVKDNIVLGEDDEVLSPAPHAFQVSFATGGIVISSGYVNALPATGADGSTVWTVGTAHKYYVEATVNGSGVATAAEVKRTTGSIPADTSTLGHQILFEVDATGRVTSEHVTSSLRHQMCAAVHQFGGLG